LLVKGKLKQGPSVLHVFIKALEGRLNVFKLFVVILGSINDQLPRCLPLKETIQFRFRRLLWFVLHKTF
jgi:hypothetical protein